MVDPPLRLAELVGTLALAQDSAFGQPLESQLRSCLLAASIGIAQAATDPGFFSARLYPVMEAADCRGCGVVWRGLSARMGGECGAAASAA